MERNDEWLGCWLQRLGAWVVWHLFDKHPIKPRHLRRWNHPARTPWIFRDH